MSKKRRIAIVHDELVRRGGAERVLEELLRMYPESDVWALYSSNDPRITVNGKTYPIHTSFLQKFPVWFRRHPSRLLPLLPQAAEQLDLSAYDLVISSSSAFAKGVVTRSTVPHVCYCHTPTRYLWEHQPKVHWVARTLLHYLRIADFASSQRPDVYIANSIYTQKRITTYYRRNSTVVYPPIHTEFFYPGKSKRTHFLVVSRLSKSKYIDHAIAVCEKLHLPLVIIGTGRQSRRLSSLAGKYTTFLGSVSDYAVREYMRSARALLQPGVEDFGMATAQALSCGTPVVAYNRGGIREIAVHGHHGVLYQHQSQESLAEGIRRFLEWEDRFIPEHLQQQALKFTTRHFQEGISRIIDTL